MFRVDSKLTVKTRETNDMVQCCSAPGKSFISGMYIKAALISILHTAVKAICEARAPSRGKTDVVLESRNKP